MTYYGSQEVGEESVVTFGASKNCEQTTRCNLSPVDRHLQTRPSLALGTVQPIPHKALATSDLRKTDLTLVELVPEKLN